MYTLRLILLLVCLHLPLTGVSQVTPKQQPAVLLKYGAKASPLLDQTEFNLDELDQDWIDTITILKGKHVRSLYGKKAKHGVVIVTFKAFDLLPGSIQTRLTEEVH